MMLSKHATKRPGVSHKKLFTKSTPSNGEEQKSSMSRKYEVLNSGSACSYSGTIFIEGSSICVPNRKIVLLILKEL